MTKKERLDAYTDLLLHTDGLYFWEYDADLQLLSTTYPNDDYMGFDSLFQIQVAPFITQSHAPYHPQLVYSFFNILWIVDYVTVNDTVEKIYVAGPTFTGKNSHNELLRQMDERNLSVKLRAATSKALASLPIIPSNILNNYAAQLHYLLTDELLDVSSILSLQNTGNVESPSISPVSHGHHGIWASEQEFLQLFREGNPDYTKALSRSGRLSSGVKHNAKDTLRTSKNSSFVLLTLISRAAIEGGVSPDVAYDLCDFYAQRIEDGDSTEENINTNQEILRTYFNKVCESKKAEGVSAVIKNCCDYIGVHINEKLSISDLAERSGYSEYYFSRKFKQEMGCNITEYIMKTKIERAKVLLATTSMSILDISLELSFNSRSYFSDTFQKIAGISPGEYRKQNVKL